MTENNKGILKIDPSKYYECKVFEFSDEDFRDTVLNYMRKMAAVKWECSGDFGMNCKWEHWGVDLSYKKGETYYGMPYTGLIVSLEQFEELIVDGKYTTNQKEWKKSPGVNCFTSLMHSFQQVEANCTYTWSLFPGQGELSSMKMVGEYETIKDAQSTHLVTETNGIDVMCEAYAKLRKGDGIGRKNQTKGYNFCHYRMITQSPIVVYDENGKIDPIKSTVKCIEQTNKFDADRTDGIRTTWRVDKPYTFSELFKDFYLPVTLYCYGKPRSMVNVPYLYLEKEIKREQLEDKTFGENRVRSNFPLRYVRISIFDYSGRFILTREKGDIANTYEISLEDEFGDALSSLEQGNYTLKLKAGIARGSHEFAQVDFELK